MSKKGKETIVDDRAVPKGFVSMGRKKPFRSSKTSHSICFVIPKDHIKDMGFEHGDEIELYKNLHGDLMLRFPLKNRS